MGILDDAIREHLDLKRRQGAADDELKRLEDEAFGPPSRPGDPDFPEAAEQPQEPAQAEAPAAVDAPVEEAAYEEPAPEPQPAAAAAAEAEIAEPEPEAVDADAGLFDQGGEELDLELELEEEIEEVGEIAVDEPGPGAEDAPIETLPTVEHHFEEAIDEAEVIEDAPDAPADSGSGEAEQAEAAEDEEDVLEETPEFLRDAPEDDELWFEQGEPKDFDF